MDSSVIGDHVNASSDSHLFLVNRTTADNTAAGGLFAVVDPSRTNEIVLRATTINNVAHNQTRCCKLTEGVYTLMGCISVTLFFLGVATIKFLR